MSENIDQQENLETQEPLVVEIDFNQARWEPIDTSQHSPKAQDLASFLSTRIRGQPRAIEAITDAYEFARSGLVNPRKPFSSLLFLGPSGTGKTEIVHAFAEYLFGDRNALIRIDCSEYQHEADVNRLIGSAAGYIRSDEVPPLAQTRIEEPARKASGDIERLKQLDNEFRRLLESFGKTGERADKLLRHLQKTKESSEQNSLEILKLERELKEAKKEMLLIRKRMAQIQTEAKRLANKRYWSIILFDELEKGHRTLQYILYQIMDAARLNVSTPGVGLSTTSFVRSFIFIAANIGWRDIEKEITGKGVLGFKTTKTSKRKEADEQKIYESAIRALERFTEPAFRGRLDNVIVFRPLSFEVLQDIASDLLVRMGRELIERYKIFIGVDEDIKVYLAKEAQKHPEEGARLLEHKVRSQIMKPIVRAATAGFIKEGDSILLRLESDGESRIVLLYDAKLRKRISRLVKKGIRTFEYRVKPESVRESEQEKE